MKHHNLFFAALAVSIGLATIVACSGDSDGVKQDTSPNNPSGSSSGGSSSGTSGSSGTTSSSSSSTSSSGASGTSGTSGATIADAAADGPKENCVPKGYQGNDKKIGHYCDKDTACPFQVSPFLICTGADDPTGVSQFCTAPCQEHSQCGTGAFCMHYPQGSGCVPTQCGGDETGKPKP